MSQDVSYQVFATMATFYVPLVVILLLYWRIFQTARSRLRNRLAQKARVPTASTVRRNNDGTNEANAQNEALLNEDAKAEKVNEGYFHTPDMIMFLLPRVKHAVNVQF